MRYSVEPSYRKYVKSYGFLSFAKKFGDKYGKKIMNNATKFADKHGKKIMDNTTKAGKDFAKTASKRILPKTLEATGDLIGNKIADKIISIGKPNSKKEKDEINEMEETQEIYIPPEK